MGLALLLVIFAAVFFFTLTSLQMTRENALVTDLSGRQRMLNQRQMKEILLAGQGIQADYPYTRAVFSETLEVLLHGGPAVLTFGKEEKMQLPPAPTEVLREKLEEQKKLWKELTAAADGLLKIPVTDPSYAPELRTFLEEGEMLHFVINDGVKLFGQHSRSRVDALIRVQLALGILIVLLGFLFTWMIARDITERKRAEERLRLIVEAAPNGMIMVGREGKIAMMNSQTEKLFGYSREELIGQRIEVLVPERYRTRHPDHRAGFFADPKVRSMGAGRDLFGLRKDGSEIPIEIGLSPIETPEGRIALASIIDITERKKLEAMIVAKSKELETTLHVVSHDLKEPLRAIEGFADKVNEVYASRLDERGQDFLRRIVNASARMGRLLDDFLALSRSKRIEQPTEEVPGEVVAREAMERLKALIEKGKARIEIAGDLPRLRANKTWAIEGVYNLIGNALKFTHPGAAPEIEIIAYRPRDKEPQEVGVVVRDRGPGVAPEHRERIFELFQRAVGHEVEGTGAGLAIVRSVAEQHGGHAWVRPREGGGSEFIITFGKAKP